MGMSCGGSGVASDMAASSVLVYFSWFHPYSLAWDFYRGFRVRVSCEIISCGPNNCLCVLLADILLSCLFRGSLWGLFYLAPGGGG